MKPFIFGKWHAWQGTQVMLSNEDKKELRAFKNTDAAINWLYLSGEKETARALNAHIKQGD
jgi:hypothetical protein